MTRYIYPSLHIAVRISLVSLFMLATSLEIAAQCNGPVFLSAPSYAADRQPFSVAVGEFNGDGKQDLAVANVGSDNVSILLGDGAGGFGPPSNISVGHQPSAVAVGDFNKDGKSDLVVAYIFFKAPSVFFGNGNATFSGPNDVGTSANTSHLAVADFNNDGNPDIAVATAGPQQILLGNGSGGFAANSVSVGSGASSVATGDFNEDGFPDAVFTATGSANWKVALVFGNAAGAFSTNTSFTVPQQPHAIAVGNFNGDSLPDLFVAIDWFEPRVVLYTNMGGGNFTLSGDVFAGRGPRAVTVGDFNGDGKLDGAAALAEANSVGIYFGDGLGHLSSPAYYGTGFQPISIASSDFNADGKLDLVTADSSNTIFAPRGPTGVSVLLGTGTDAFESYRSYANPFTPGFVLTPSGIASGDFNSTSRPDLALTFAFTSLVGIMLDNGQGGFNEPVFLDAGGTPASLAVSDLNGDNNADIVTANSNSSNISIFFGLGNGLFMPRVQISANLTPKLVAVGDFNGDGKRDLIVTHDSTANAIILLGDGTGGFVPTGGSPQPAVKEIAVGDFNGDGRTDVVAGNSPQNNVSIFLSDATGHLNLSSTTPSLSVNTITRLHVADLNADNKQDVIVANVDRNDITVFLGDGTGGLSAGTNYASEPRPFDLATADFDGDGELDLAVANNGGQTASLYSGNGSGGFNSPVSYPAGVNPNGLATGDFNQDSKVDLAVMSGTSYGVAILQNIQSPLPCLSVNDVTVTEGDNGSVNLGFAISLSQSSLQTIRVNYSLVDETATKGADYTNLFDRLVFAPGETTKTISVPVLGDVLNEVNETFKLQLASPSKAAIGDGEGRGTILDNDPIPTISINDISNVEANLLRNFTVSLSAVSGRDVTVKYATANGTAVGGNFDSGDFFPTSGTLTIPAGQPSAQVSIQTFDDATFEPDETFFLNLSDPTAATISDSQGQATIVNNDPIPTIDVHDAFITEGNSGTTQGAFIVRLSNPTWQTVTLNFSTSDDTAKAGADYVAASSSLTFLPGETDKTAIVLINGDTVDETVKLFFLDIANVQNATVGRSRATGFILDDDGPNISVNDVSVVEGNSGTKSATFTLTLSAPSVEGISVRATITPGTASVFSDYNPINLNITVPAGTLTRTFNVSIIGDTNPEPDETFTVNLSNVFNATIDDGQGTGTILDDDTLRLVLDESGPDPQQAAALDSVLLVRDPFHVQSFADWWLNLFPDPNTRVMLFAQNLQLNQGETASAVTVNLVDANNQSFDLPAEDVRTAPNSSFTQVVFRLPDGLAAGSCKVTIKAHSQTSNIGNIRIAP